MRIPLLVSLALLCGCATLSESDCRSTNWAELGKRHGSMGVNWQVDQHAHHCSRYGVQVDEQAYMTAWREAYSDWAMRTNPGSGDN